MRALTDRGQLLLEMDTARGRAMEAIAGLTEAQMSQPGLDGWSVKDVLNHLTACDEFRFFEIEKVSRSGRLAYPGLSSDESDSLNHLIVTKRRSLSLSEVLRDLDAVRALVLEAISRAPDSALDPAAYVDYPVNGSISHDREHAAAIRAWRKREGI